MVLSGSVALAQATVPAARPNPRPAATAAAPAARPAAAPAARAAPAAPAADVVARIGSIDVKADEVRALVAGLGERERAALDADPSRLGQAVRSMLATRMLLKEALDKKWDQTPAVAEHLRKVREAAIAETYLASVAKVPADYPPEADIRAAYEANRTALVVPRSFQVAQIFVAGARDADKPTLDAARKKLAEIEAKLKQPGADFGAVARDLSDSRQTAERGGEIGWVSESQIRPELRAILLGLAKNGVADPVQLDDGWHILKLVDTRAAATRPYDEVRDQLAGRLREERATQMRRAYMAELLRRTPPVVNEFALSKALEDGKSAKP
ncbi:peptidylprolyl isomerase [Rhodoplanes tepidamans]|uniref:Parvulin-like PPIase n=2 Tax=Rhodoplanes TaxID=29407 RepID=A0ABT5JDB3_RHOTP|nr:peptidylprolyl isomerase [Rhodoplanes tepidamans]MDC7787025.1 peptidylprolyl isomerase [Rhodoplanes tepidamans]MDQ0354250.1 peptidylprolyl isomerase [Rhodoplanes tepidamans]